MRQWEVVGVVGLKLLNSGLTRFRVIVMMMNSNDVSADNEW